MFIGGFELFPAGEGGSEHEDGRFGGVEIGDEAVYDLEFETWVNENIIFAGGFTSFGPKFERASDGGTNRNNTMAGGFCSFDGFDSVVGKKEPFGMHMVVFNIVAADGEKSAKADVQGEVFDLNAFGLNFLQEFFGHVEAGGGGGGGAELFGPDSLVTFDIFFVGVAMEIGG